MSFYSDASRAVYDGFVEYGSAVTLTRTPATGTASGSPSSGTAVSSSSYAMSFPVAKGSSEAFDNRLEDGSLAGKVLRYLKIAAYGMTLEPRSLDKLTFDGVTWEVLGCTPLKPGSTPLFYGVGAVKL